MVRGVVISCIAVVAKASSEKCRKTRMVNGKAKLNEYNELSTVQGCIRELVHGYNVLDRKRVAGPGSLHLYGRITDVGT